MRILTVGAGGIGGYFGARLLAAGRDVTFLVRPARAALLANNGLIVRSPFGDLNLPAPPTVTAPDLKRTFDLVLLSCKSYDLDTCMSDVAPAMAAGSRIVPLLNGMRHMDKLDERFGAERVLGGLARISSALDGHGVIHHFGQYQTLVLGSRTPQEGLLEELSRILSVPGFETSISRKIVQDLWEKWVFIAAAGALTCLMRASVGDIVASGGGEIARGLIAECAAIAAENGFAPSAATVEIAVSILTGPGSEFTASMFRDIENNSRIEADHIVGDLLGRSREPRPLLKLAYAHLKAYEARRMREAPRFR
jgi:2-dehydropantoate 2-reductase